MKYLLLTLFVGLSNAQGFAMDSLSELHWKKRVLLVFGDAGDPRITRQMELLASRNAELAERDMVLIRFSGENADVAYGDGPTLDAIALRKEADAHEGFHVVLVGKDGGVKLRSQTVVNDLELFGLIDRMPMRQEEKGRKQ